MRRLLKRFRWPLAFGLATLLILTYVLQPRPMAEYRLKDSNRFFGGEAIQISPSGNYLLISHRAVPLYLYRLDGMQLILELGENKGLCGFDAEDGLAFASYGAAKENEYGTLMEFWHWQPGQSSPRKVASRPREVLSSGVYDSGRFNGLVSFGNRYFIDCLLSPDCKTWLFPNRKKSSLYFDLIDAKTGETRAQLEMPAINLEMPDVTRLDVAYSADSKQLLAQVEGHYSNEPFLLERFDVQTGKCLAIITMPDNSRLGHFCQLEDDRVVALQSNENNLTMQSYSMDKGYELRSLPETLPVPEEVPYPPSSDNLWTAHLDPLTFQFHCSNSQLVYCWEHALRPKAGVMLGEPPSLPGFHYAVRDIKTGALLHTETLNDPPEGWKLINILSDNTLVLQQSSETLAPWQEKLERWRWDYASWLPDVFEKNHARLQLIEPATGRSLGQLTISKDYPAVFQHQQQNALYASGYRGDGFTIQKYAYPLRKPWLLILSWTFGAFISLAGLQWLIQRRRSTAQPRTL